MGESEREQVSGEELEEQEGEMLPDREEMSPLDIGGPLGGGVTLPVEPPASE